MAKRLKTKLVQLLRWSEKYIKTDMTYLTKGGFWLLLGHGIQMISGLVLTIAFVNLLPKEIYGTYQFIISAATVVSAFTLTGMTTAVSRAAARGEDGSMRPAVRTQFVWSSGIVLAGAALAVYYYANGNNTLALSFLIVGTFAPFVEGFGLARSYLIGKKLFKESTMLGLWRRFIPVVSLLLTLLLTHNPVALIFAYFCSNAVSAGILYWIIVRKYRLPYKRDPELTAYSKHLSFIRTISDITNQVDKILVWTFLGAVPLAVYTLAQFPVTHIQSIFKVLRGLTFPKMNVVSFNELQQILPHKARVFLLGNVGIVAIYILIAPVVFALLFPTYHESVLISQLLVLTILASPRTLYWQALVAHDKKREMYIVSFSQNIVKLILLLILLPLYGIWGAIGALLLTNIYDNILIRIMFKYAK